ncbi:MAG: peptidylprolyl isomerase [Sphingomonadaceae bacterium]
MFIRFASCLALLICPVSLAQAQGGQAQQADTPPGAETPVTQAPFALQTIAIETTLGTITVALETERAPLTASNFLRYVDQNRLDGTQFYRAMRLDWGEQPNGLIQGGVQMAPDRVLPPVAHEPTSATGVRHRAGTLSMARYEPGSATADFSIMLADQPGMDADPDSTDPELRAGYAAFGHVVSGMDVVRSIFDSPTDPDKGEGWMKGQMLASPVKILRVYRVEDKSINATP